MKKERREKYKDGKLLKKESVAYLSDENMLFIIERFEKEFYDEITSIESFIHNFVTIRLL